MNSVKINNDMSNLMPCPITEIQRCCGTLCNPKQIEEYIVYLQRTVVELRAELLKNTSEAADVY